MSLFPREWRDSASYLSCNHQSARVRFVKLRDVKTEVIIKRVAYILLVSVAASCNRHLHGRGAQEHDVDTGVPEFSLDIAREFRETQDAINTHLAVDCVILDHCKRCAGAICVFLDLPEHVRKSIGAAQVPALYPRRDNSTVESVADSGARQRGVNP